MRVRGFAIGALFAASACGGAPPPTPPLALAHTSPIDLGSAAPAALVEQGDNVYALSGRIATVMRGGIVTAKAEAHHPWIGGAVIAAPDGDGRWVIALDDQGALWRVTIAGELEAVADRLGLDGAHVLAIGGAGTTFAAELPDAIAYTTDGLHLTRVAAAPARAFSVARGQLARSIAATATVPAHVERWDLAHGTMQTYALDASQLAFLDADTDHPRLVAADRAGVRVYVETDRQLEPYATPGAIRTIAARGDHLWVTTNDELWLFDKGKLLATRRDDRDVTLLAASATGDAWLGTKRGLVRYSLGAAGDDPRWQDEVAPVFQRTCAHCHLPGGEAGIDLSTAASWTTARAEISRRVLVTRTMPPAGTDMNDADRASLAQWLGAK